MPKKRKRHPDPSASTGPMKFFNSFSTYLNISVLSIICLTWILISCTKIPEIPPRFAYPGYEAKIAFHDDFSLGMENWIREGNGSATITDGRMLLESDLESEGLMAWIDRELPEDFQIEYEVQIPETAGINTVVLCAQGPDGQSIFKLPEPRMGRLHDYSESEIRSYHVSFHCYGTDGIHDPGSKIRKNPGHMLLSRVQPDPCMENRRYLIDILKIGNRILLYVDEGLVHDIRDRGGFGSPKAPRG